ncbi:MAG: hypothetical protein JO347_03000 [Candidatus Eremiobacteraeota bacterium]|nr:hypothetical protein [Candidatus Eremiobacteraeota bacterium]
MPFATASRHSDRCDDTTTATTAFRHSDCRDDTTTAAAPLDGHCPGYPAPTYSPFPAYGCDGRDFTLLSSCHLRTHPHPAE